MDFDAFSDIELLDYYTYEWDKISPFRRNEALDHLVQARAPSTIISAVLSPCKEFFAIIQGDSRRLTKAVCAFLRQRRNGNLTPAYAPSIPPSPGSFLRAFEEYIISMGYGKFDTELGQIQDELSQATEAYYRTERPFIPDGDTLPSYLNHVAALISIELHLDLLRSGIIAYQTTTPCIKILMEDYWGQMFDKLEGLINTGNDSDQCLHPIRAILPWTHDEGIRQFHRSLMKPFKCHVEAGMDKWRGNGIPLLETRLAYASGLLDFKKQQTEKAQRVLGWGCDDLVDQAFQEVLEAYPLWHEAVDELLAEQEGEVFRALFAMGDEVDNASVEEPSSLHLGQRSSQDDDHHSSQIRSGVEPLKSDPNQTPRDSERDLSTEKTSEASSIIQAPSNAAPGSSNQEEKKGKGREKKRDKLMQSVRKVFKRR